MASERSRLPWILVLLLLVATVAMGMMLSRARGQRNEQARLREAETAAAAGKLAAALRSKAELRDQLTSENRDLRNQVAEVEDVAPKVEVREVVKWKTKEIEVPVDRIIRVPTTDTPRGDNCAIEITPEQPVAFQIEGSEGRLESRAGNWFAVGTVSLFQTKPPPRRLLGTSRIEITDLGVVDERRKASWALTLFAGLETEGIEFGGGWHGRSRWGFYAKARYDPSPVMFDNYQLSQNWYFGGGATFTIGPR